MRGISWCVLIIISAIAFVTKVSRAEDGCLTNKTVEKFPTCNGTMVCPPGCTSVNIVEVFNATESLAIQDTTNVLCVDNTALKDTPATYRLTGCARDDYFEPTLNTTGICYADMQDPRQDGLYLTASRMVPGIHSFTCLNENRPSLRSYVVVVNSSTLFREIQVYVNNEEPCPLTNVRVIEGDELTIVARAVGNVNFIEVKATSPAHGENATQRFSCETKFLCNQSSDGLNSRFQRCSLRARLSDNATTIQFLINNVGVISELGKVNITVNALPVAVTTTTIRPTPSPSERAPPSNGDSSSTGIIVGVVIPLLLVILVIVVIIVILHVIRRRRSKYRSPEQQHINFSSSSKGRDSIDYKAVGAANTGSTSQLKVLVYSCDHRKEVGSLISKLEEKEHFEVQKLVDDESCQSLSDYVTKLSFELTYGAVLLDCSCNIDHNSDLDKAVRSLTLRPLKSSESDKPLGSSESDGSLEAEKWNVLQLLHTGSESQSSPSRSALFDHVGQMCYNELDDSFTSAVVDELENHIRNRRASGSSINSSKSDAHLLNDQKLEEIATTVKRIEKGTIKLREEAAYYHREEVEDLNDLKENVTVVLERQEAVATDVLRQAENKENL